MIGLTQAATTGLTSLDGANDDFDSRVSSANPAPGDTGAAALLLADVIALTTDVSIRLLLEVDTIADAARASVADLQAMEQFASERADDLNSQIQ